jgi:sugar phosphate isomerase/epimerase
MKLSFWAVAEVGNAATIPEIVNEAAEYGYQGVDIRATRPINGKPSDGGLICIDSRPAEIDALREAFASQGIEIPTLLFYPPVGDDIDWDLYEADVAAHARLAEQIGATCIRPRTGHPAPGVSWDEHLGRLFECTQRGVEDTPTVGVVIENHPGEANARQLLQTAELFGPRFGVLLAPDWMLLMQEDSLEIIDRYAPYIVELCYADAVLSGTDPDFHLERRGFNEGEVPYPAIISALDSRGFTGYVTLKDPLHDVRIPRVELLTAYVEYMRQFNVLDEQQVS